MHRSLHEVRGLQSPRARRQPPRPGEAVGVGEEQELAARLRDAPVARRGGP